MADIKQTLVIGSTVVDVLLRVPRLPVRGGDVNITSSSFRIGGCAYNVYRAVRRLDVPALLCSPVGKGIFGRMVREHLEREGIAPFISLEEENGCCYCLVEADGERSFLSHHGAEYRFDRRWMAGAGDLFRTDSLFVCGIDVEDPTGDEIVEFAAAYTSAGLASPGVPRLFFAPGPRIAHIPRARLEKLLTLRPFLHLNETEAFAACALFDGRAPSGSEDIPGAAWALAARSGNSLVITLGGKGCYFLAWQAPGDGAAHNQSASGCVPAPAVQAANTVGAGDAHCGTIIACLKLGKSLKEACEIANETAAAFIVRPG